MARVPVDPTKVRAELARRRLSQRQACIRAGIKQQTLSAALRNGHMDTVSYAKLLAAVLSYEPDPNFELFAPDPKAVAS